MSPDGPATPEIAKSAARVPVVIAGGSGFLGISLARQLSEALRDCL